MNRRPRKSNLLVAVAAALLAPAVWAGSESGNIEPGWFAYSDGLVFLFLAGTHANSPCSITERWVIDPSTSIGKTHFTVFLSAYTSGRSIALVGSNTCAHSNTEIVATITVLD